MNNEIYHYGIEGMKWGVRRYQNENGTLTNAGKRRYSQDKNGNYHKIRGRSLKARTADEIANNLEKMKDTKRMSYMSSRQRASYNKASKYWDDRASGKNEINRGIIRRMADRQRSYSIGERAAIQMGSSVLSKTRTNILVGATGLGVKTSAGKIAVDSAMETAGSLIIDEITNKAFGHF